VKRAQEEVEGFPSIGYHARVYSCVSLPLVLVFKESTSISSMFFLIVME